MPIRIQSWNNANLLSDRLYVYITGPQQDFKAFERFSCVICEKSMYIFYVKMVGSGKMEQSDRIHNTAEMPGH